MLYQNNNACTMRLLFYNMYIRVSVATSGSFLWNYEKYKKYKISRTSKDLAEMKVNNNS